MKIHNYKFFGLGLFFIGVVMLGQELYRPWINRNGIDDFGLANYWPSFFGCFCAVFFALSFVKKNEIVSCSIWTGVGCIAYEILQPWLGTGVFDWADLLAVCIAGVISTLGLLALSTRSQSKHASKT